jgi:SAM-dependent methyltransferase
VSTAERAPLPPDLQAVAARKVTVLAEVIAARAPDAERLLVVGCGSGREAVVLARHLGVEVVGVDLDARFDREARQAVTLLRMDGETLALPSGSFDVVYSFHALEHMAHPDRALAEMRRVLAPGGTYCVGTPNRSRLVGYVGSPTTWRKKVKLNMADWCMRARGRWRNADGAHAGFEAPVLVAMCEDAFGVAEDLTAVYYDQLYARRRRQLALVRRAGLERFVHPCVYVIGTLRAS